MKYRDIIMLFLVVMGLIIGLNWVLHSDDKAPMPRNGTFPRIIGDPPEMDSVAIARLDSLRRIDRSIAGY